MAQSTAFTSSFILFGFVLMKIGDSYASNNPVVAIDLGRIKGSVLHSRLGNSFYAFRGIRYAKAPIDELRFEVSQ